MVLENILVTGAFGRLGSELTKFIKKDYELVFTPSREEFSIDSMESIEKFCENKKIDIILNLAAYTDVPMSSSLRGSVQSILSNAIGAANLTMYSIKNNIKLIHVSTDAVFDGTKGGYNPSDKICPITNYGRTKASSELVVMCHPNSKIIRTSFISDEFPYTYALEDQYTSRDYLSKMLPLIYEEVLRFEPSTVVHVGTERKTMLELAVQTNDNIEVKKVSDLNFKVPLDNSFGSTKRGKYV